MTSDSTTASAADAPDGDATVSNVVLVTVDSLRADAVSPYDAERHSPVIDDLADGGTVFDRAFATGNWTPFSFPSILASESVFARSGDIGVDESDTLAEALSEAGIATGGFNAANGFLTDHWGYPDGFDEFEPFVTSVGSSVYSRYLAAHPTVEAWIQLATSPVRRFGSKLRGDADDRPFLDASRMFDVEDAAAEFIDDADEPFFLWVHYMDTHTPYVPAPRYIREVSDGIVGTHQMLHAHARTSFGLEVDERTLRELRTLYQATVRQVDASVGRLLDRLDAAGVADDTAVLVAGDHGEEFQEHGHLAHYPKLYDELIHVPLVADVPGLDGGRVDGHVGLDAIPPTVADLLGVEPSAEWHGESLLPALRGDAVSTRDSADDPAAEPTDDPAAEPTEDPVVKLTNDPVVKLTNDPVVELTNDPVVELTNDPVVSVTVRGEDVTQQPIPRSLSDGDLLVSARDDDWTYIENVDTDAAELYHRPSDPTQQENLAADPDERAQAVIDRLKPVIDAHAELLRERGAAAAKRGEDDDDEVDEDLEARLEALGYK